jgi:hypothetical protein
MIGLIFWEGFGCKAKKIDEYSQAPQGEGRFVCFFLGREVIVVIFVEDVSEMVEKELVQDDIT